MQQIRTYNHSKPRDDADKVSFFYVAARISLLGPILCGILLRGAVYGLQGMHYAGLVLIVGGLVTVAVNVICFILGFIALFGMVRYGTQGVLVRAVLGILLSGLSLGMFGAGFVRGFQMAWKQHQFVARARSTPDQSDTNSGSELLNGSDSTNGNSPETATRGDATASNDAKSTSRNSTATNSQPVDTSLAGRALVSFQAQQQNLMTAYDAAALAIKTPPVLSMNGVTNREQLIARKLLVIKFLDVNEKWLGFTTKAEVTFRNEMVRLNATTSTVDAGLKEYRQAAGDRDFALIRARGSDQRIGTVTLNMLAVLEANWGSWSYNTEKNTLSFRNSAVAAQYNDIFSDLNDAKAEQAQAQAELSRQSEPTPPAKPSL